MKNRVIKKWLRGLGLWFFCLLSFATWTYGQAQDEYCASLADFEGEVFIQKAGEEDWLPVEKGMPLENQDRLKTGNDGYAEILYDDGSLVKMEENSEITLEEVSADYKSKKISSKVSLWFGRLLLNIAKFTHSQSRFTVKTPTVVAGVRGTEFVVESLTEEKSDVGVVEGEVGVEGLDEQGKSVESSRVILKRGFQTSGFKFQKPVRPIPLKEQMLQHTVKIELLRKKALDTRKNLPKIMENRIKTRQIIIEKWKNYREQNPVLRKPNEDLRNPKLQRLPGNPNRPQGPQIERLPKGSGQTPQIQRLPKGSGQPQNPQLQKLPPPGSTQPDKGIRKLPPPYIRKPPPPQSGANSIKNDSYTTPSPGAAGNPPVLNKLPENRGSPPPAGPVLTQPTTPRVTAAPLVKPPITTPDNK
ncbi:MAG: hypothetical protein EHM45_18080 [Desulfobacteraceae bacterium]|nr:MAG: hypothetical protein EHM45_18080 [Desulfobacteraceae bacterium]